MPRTQPPPAAAPSEPNAVLAEVDAALSSSDWARALDIALRGQERFPDDAELRHARGVALRGLGRHDEALAAFDEAMALDPGFPDPYLDAAELLVDEVGDDVRALEVLGRARRRVEDTVPLAEVALLRSVALAHLDDFEGALRTLDEAARLDAGNPDVPAERGSVLVEVLRLEEAEQQLRRALELSADNARAHQLLAFLLDYTGRREEAEPHFRSASEIDARAPQVPPRLTEAEFDVAVEAALKQVPPRFAQHLENVEISVENYADREFCRRHDCSPMTLGLYVGTPLPLRESGSEKLPDRIVLFQRAIENTCRTRDEVVDEIAVTLKHEIGHFLGFEEEELVERGYE